MICFDMLFPWRDMRKFVSYKYVAGNNKNIFMLLLDNCGYFSLVLQANLTSGSAFMVTYNVESEALSINTRYCGKIHCSVLQFERIFIQAWFLTLSIDH